MKHLIFLVMLATTIATNAQNNYETTVGSALELMQKGEMLKAEGIFERVSQAETDQWLPHYYVAHINNLLSWGEQDQQQLKSKLDKAQSEIEKAMAISPNNPELLVMQAQILTNWVSHDGQTYGMMYSAKINELYGKAAQIAPNNPRVVYCKAQWDMGSAKYFGKDVTPYCDQINTSLELFANFKPESSISPNWGEEQANQLSKQCK
ncbi:hypothetical protein SAMN03097699_0201 [Flavobacteriaceae bacterium MAR_2010_188]|nr:hypothetical protein SAMN03097699_0201 [Flavobacteriaceae bacterium MAR_2010_188]